MTAFDIYLITRCDPLLSTSRVICIFSAIALVIACVVAFAASVDEMDEILTGVRKAIRYIILPMFIPSIFLQALMPSTKEAIAMVLIPAAINNEEIQRVLENALKLFNTQLEAWLEDVGIRGSEVDIAVE